MLLRRIVEHARAQHWTAIGIDLAIVVLGVFIGMQVSNWNQALSDARLGRAYAGRLATDLEHDLASRRALAAYYGAVLESVERTDALLADPQAPAQDLVVEAYRASEISYTPPSRATWDEIVSSGDTGLLDGDVARSVAEYFSSDPPLTSFDVLKGSGYRMRVRTIIPLPVQKALRAGCSDERNALQQVTGFMPGCRLDLEPATIAAAAADLRADPAVQQTLRLQYSEVFSAHANIAGDVVAIERALAALHRAPPAAETAP